MAHKMIIGITGQSKSGKDTVADALSHIGYTKLSFAHPLKGAIAHMLDMSVGEIEKHKEEYVSELGCTIRYMLQTLGTEWGRDIIHHDMWCMVMKRRARQYTDVVISDVRFNNEARLIHEMGGHIIRVVRPGGQTCADHSSEMGIGDEYVDRTLTNDRSIRALQETAIDLARNTKIDF